MKRVTLCLCDDCIAETITCMGAPATCKLISADDCIEYNLTCDYCGTDETELYEVETVI